MAAVALNSLQPSTLSGSNFDININRPKLRTSRTDPSIATTARKYSSSSALSISTTSENNHSSSTHPTCRRLSSSPLNKSRQRPQSAREHSLTTKRLRPDPQPNDPCSSPNSSGRLAQRITNSSSVSSSSSSRQPPIQRDFYRINNNTSRQKHNRNSSMNSSRDASFASTSTTSTTTTVATNRRYKRPTSNSRHERAASLGSAAARSRCCAQFSLTDFKLGKVLGAGGTATVIRAELINPQNSLMKQHNDAQAEYGKSDSINDISQYKINSKVPNKTHQRRQSECISNGTTMGLVNPNNISGNALLWPSAGKTIEFALKVVQKKALSKRALHYLTREIMIHRAVQSHFNVVSLYDVFEDSNAVYLVQELLKGGDLFSALRRERHGVSELTALEIVDQILEALCYMHTHGFAHRDIKPENIMFSERPALGEGRVGVVKLIDFGLACARDPKVPVRERTSAEKCGTIRYAAPEVVTDASYIPELADVWSVGVVLYSAIAHRNPFCGKTEKDVLDQIENSAPPLSGAEWKKVSFETKQLITRMLCRKPSDRPSAQQALRVVQKIRVNLGHSTGGRRNVHSNNSNGDSCTKEGNGNKTGTQRTTEGDGKCGEQQPQQPQQHQPNIFDGILALFNGNSKESSS